jgi:hypothetical protein
VEDGGATFSSWARKGVAPGGGGGGKTLWPELLGRIDVDAAHAILEDRHDVRVYDYGENAPPPGFDPNRVALFSDYNLCIVTVPKVG